MLKSRLEKHYEKVVLEDFLLLYNYKNIDSLPRMDKLILHCSSKKFSLDENALLESFSTLLLATACRPVISKAYKSIAQFSIRKDDSLGVRVVLRKKRLFDLLEKLSLFVIPNNLVTRRFDVQKKKKLRKSAGLLENKETRSFSVSGKDTKAFPEISILLLSFSSFTGFDVTGFFSNNKPVLSSFHQLKSFQSSQSKKTYIEESSVNRVQGYLPNSRALVIDNNRFSENLFTDKRDNLLSTQVLSTFEEKEQLHAITSSTSFLRIKDQWLSAFQFPYNIKA